MGSHQSIHIEEGKRDLQPDLQNVFLSMLPAEPRQSRSIGDRSRVDSETVRFWQGGGNAENEKEACCMSDKEASGVWFKRLAFSWELGEGDWRWAVLSSTSYQQHSPK